ncbi:ketopantoate reductase family protein [Pseudoalteromonas sp. G4]|uniref:ketopantoate reductase family protein n=1 Tax=Pseudoalteromonas sp. G4 TaxID=2992761 RepID=UPI00237E5B78|nr:2-dehydropantoate 2-reductase [Pseudoalteromonas sp. G4]MDE3273790.1 2-dehydropantoate 2-reductase [Pseudoalteromonas sp. G4]
MKNKNTANKPKLHIVGHGAIGLLLAYYLRQYFDITLIVRNKKKHTETVLFNELNRSLCEFKVTTATCDEVQHIEQLIIPTKSHQVDAVLDSLKNKLADTATVILCHNGMPNLALIKQKLAKQQVYFLTTSMAALKHADFTVEHTGFGASFIGALKTNGQKTQAIEYLLNALPNITIEQNINALLWQKLIINIAINPLTAVHQVKNGALVAPQYASDIFGLVNEAVFIANKEGMKISLNSALESAYRVMRATAQNFSSMNRDVFKQQQTEIDSICGYIHKKGAEYCYPTPFNSRFLTLIQGDTP